MAGALLRPRSRKLAPWAVAGIFDGEIHAVAVRRDADMHSGVRSSSHRLAVFSGRLELPALGHQFRALPDDVRHLRVVDEGDGRNLAAAIDIQRRLQLEQHGLVRVVRSGWMKWHGEYASERQREGCP